MEGIVTDKIYTCVLSRLCKSQLDMNVMEMAIEFEALRSLLRLLVVERQQFAKNDWVLEDDTDALYDKLIESRVAASAALVDFAGVVVK